MCIWVQKLASMQKRTSPLKFGDLAEKSGFNSVSPIFQLSHGHDDLRPGHGVRGAQEGARGPGKGCGKVPRDREEGRAGGCSAVVEGTFNIFQCIKY